MTQTYVLYLCFEHGINVQSGSSLLKMQTLLILYTTFGGYIGPTGVDSLIIIRTGGSSMPGNEITPNMPAVMPKHSISSTDDKSQPFLSIKTLKINHLDLQRSIA